MADTQDDKRVNTNDDNQAQSNFLNALSFRQYMRNQNEDDRELMEKFMENIPVPEGWSIEDHMGDFRPAIWLRKDSYVIQVYSTMGAISAMFGEIKRPNGSDVQDPNEMRLSGKKQDDFSMIYPIFPAKEIPHENEEEDNDDDDFEKAAEALTDFNIGCLEYINSLSKKNDEEDSLADKLARQDIGSASSNNDSQRSDPVNNNG